MPRNCVTLWIGDRLGPVERACMQSVLRLGHHLVLYCYETPKGTPVGVQVEDAAAILPREAIVRHRGGSVAPFADWFRYVVQQRGLGTWIDADMYFLRPLDEMREYLFGEEREGVVNNAVLRLPPNSPVLDDLLLPFAKKTPWWLPPRRRFQSTVREWITGKANVGTMPWGTTGPAALTAVVEKFGLSREALPRSVFYPVPWEKAAWILDPAIRIDDIASSDTVGVHLWNECIRVFKDRPAPTGSFLHRLQLEGRD